MRGVSAGIVLGRDDDRRDEKGKDKAKLGTVGRRSGRGSEADIFIIFRSLSGSSALEASRAGISRKLWRCSSDTAEIFSQKSAVGHIWSCSRVR